LHEQEATMPTMNVSLTNELAKFVADEIQEGEYASASEVVRDGLRRLLRDKAIRAEKLAILRQAVQVGLDDVEAGRIYAGTINDIGEEERGER
jgi:antitoxin ParD1/3/4